MSHTAFFYGTLMAPQVLHRVIWGSPSPPTPAHAALLTIRPALLHAHQRRKVRRADYPAILPADASSTVRGTLVEGLTDGDIWRLDIFEGDEYARRKVKVRVLRQEQGAADHHSNEVEVEAETYIWIAGEFRLDDGEWDFAEFVKDKMARWVGHDAGADDGLKDVDDAVALLGDPTGGRGAGGHVANQLQSTHAETEAEEVLKSAV